MELIVAFCGYPHAIIQIFRWGNGRLSIPDTSIYLYYTRSTPYGNPLYGYDPSRW